MFSDKSCIYLPIRALGDFLISATVVKNKFNCKIPMLIPPYLKEFFDATNSEKHFEIIDTVNYNDQPAFYELYKVKDLRNVKRLIKDTRTFYSLTNNKNTYLLDYSSKRLSFSRSALVWPDVSENIYVGKDIMFSDYFEKKINVADDKISLDFSRFHKVLILPGSRIQTKRINAHLLHQIQNSFTNLKIDIAEFGNDDLSRQNIIFFSGFQNLIALIKNYDLIISAESLPYHLAYYLNKPHFVIYNESKHFKRTFMTPFMLQNNFYSTFKNIKSNDVLNKLKTILN